MSMFKWAEEESKGSPMFASALAGGALASMPAARYISNEVVLPSIKNLDQQIIDRGGELNIEQVKAIKDRLIDKSIRDKLLLVTNKGANPGFVIT